jgi:hypothetical protein
VVVDLVPAERTALFNGASPADVILAATDAANQLADVIKQRRLYQRIGSRDHVLVEGWQALGTLVGVFAVKDGGVRELPWPILAALGEEPEDSRTAAHQAWEQHRALLAQRDLGRAYGFSAAYRAVKDGRDVGWGEGRCERSEKTWLARDDYALASMAQTRGQGRTLKQPLGWLIHLAGYSTTPMEEMPDVASEPTSPYGVTVDADADAEAARVIETLFADVDGAALVRIVNRRFGTDHLPDAAAKMVDAMRWAHDSDVVRITDPDVSAEQGAPPDE